jgi:hypothetical protein
MGVVEFAIAVGLGIAGCGGVYYYIRDETRADALFDKRNDREIFYESIRKAPVKNRLSYALFSSHYAKNYIKNHPIPELR